MIPILQALPLDWTAAQPNNRTKSELHNISSQFDLPYRIMVLDKGYFYLKNLILMDNTGRVLSPETDYITLAMEPEVTRKTGITACAVIAITNPSVGNYIYIDAQMVGGKYCSLNEAILATAANVIQVANRPVKWENLVGKPSSYRPNGHLHALWELFGFTPQTEIIHRMTTAMNGMATTEFNNLYSEFLTQFNRVTGGLEDLDARLQTHIADHANPHKVTGTQVITTRIVNGSPATLAQARTASGTVMNSYATPLRTMDSIKANFLPNLVAHATDYNNPHNTTAAQLGTITNIELQSQGNQYYNRGDTVAYSIGFDNLSTGQFYTDVRTNIPVTALTSGLMGWSLYSASPGNASQVGCPGLNGVIIWRSIAEIFDLYVTKGNMVLYAGVRATNTTSASLGLIVGTNWPNGTICAVRYTASYDLYNGNGSTVSVVTTLGMATIVNNVWTSPGWI